MIGLYCNRKLARQALHSGAKADISSCDVDLNPFGGGDYGVSRIHAIIRFDRAVSTVC